MHMGHFGPQAHFSVICLGITIAQGIAATCGGVSVFTVAVGVGGAGQSFLVSNKFSETDPVLGHGILALGVTLDMSSSCGGLESLAEEIS